MASEQVQKKGGFHYAFLIVAAGIAITCIPCALVLSCAGIYFTPVSSYFGVPKASFTLYFSILNLAMMIMLPIGGKLMSKMDARVVLSAAVIIDGLTLIAMSFFTAVWQFYIAGVLLGIGTAPLIYLAGLVFVGRFFLTPIRGWTRAMYRVGGILLLLPVILLLLISLSFYAFSPR